MTKEYFNPQDLKKFGKITKFQEKMGKQFFEWYNGVFKGDTALTEREKSLIALAVAHTVQCPYCIDAYTSSCLEKGADVAAAIKGGSTLVFGVQMMNHAEKLSM
jgi:alkylhydroperoxidase/carboxymuconolactone decarboxylase family protein